tara:strand:+ start:21 stop:281 length:261 start_codon:yes stop_codon:yes gene_type:complete
METFNRSVLDIYLQTNCLGKIQNQDLEFLTDIKNYGNPSDFKLIQHIKSKIASGEIRITETSQSKIISLNRKIPQKTNKFSANLSI